MPIYTKKPPSQNMTHKIMAGVWVNGQQINMWLFGAGEFQSKIVFHWVTERAT